MTARRALQVFKPGFSSRAFRAWPRLLPARSWACSTTPEGWISTRMQHFSVDEKVHIPGRSFRELGIRIECVRDTFEAMELHRNLDISQPFEEPFATFDGYG